MVVSTCLGFQHSAFPDLCCCSCCRGAHYGHVSFGALSDTFRSEVPENNQIPLICQGLRLFRGFHFEPSRFVTGARRKIIQLGTGEIVLVVAGRTRHVHTYLLADRRSEKRAVSIRPEDRGRRRPNRLTGIPLNFSIRRPVVLNVETVQCPKKLMSLICHWSAAWSVLCDG